MWTLTKVLTEAQNIRTKRGLKISRDHLILYFQKFYILQGKLYYILFFRNFMRNHSIHETDKNKTAMDGFLRCFWISTVCLYHFMKVRTSRETRDCVTCNFDKHWSKCLVLVWVKKAYSMTRFWMQVVPSEGDPRSTSREVGNDTGMGRQPIQGALMYRSPLWATRKAV